jgi:AcrR family transcriptional regulator
MGKGERTRKGIIDQAFLIAADQGLEGVTLGSLAAKTGLSKSGLFAHFKSKEALQLDLLEDIVSRYTASVVVPALQTPRGERRVRALMERKIHWVIHNHPNCGCVFMALAHEYDDRPGPVRDRVTEAHRAWHDTIRRVTQTAVEKGDFRADLDPDLFAYEFLGIEMAFQHSLKLLADPLAERQVQIAFENLITRSRPLLAPSNQ